MDFVLVLLSCVSGSVDAIGYFKLGHVFTANMTGNTVLLGISLAVGNKEAAVRSLVALLGFIVGVFAGGALVSYHKKGWKSELKICLTIEFFLMVIMSVLWWIFFSRHHTFVVFASIIVSAFAMGIQSATIKHLRIPGVVTTFITGTITSIISEVGRNLKSIFFHVEKDKKVLPKTLEQRMGLQAMIFLAYLGMAFMRPLLFILSDSIFYLYCL